MNNKCNICSPNKPTQVVPAPNLSSWFNSQEGKERLKLLKEETNKIREALYKAAYVPDELLKKKMTI